MQVDCLIVGQGISGSFLSWYLKQYQLSYKVIDQAVSNSPSRVAAGIINPVTGRRYVETWMINDLLPFAREVYTGLGRFLNLEAFRESYLIDFFADPQMKLGFEKRLAENAAYLRAGDDSPFREFFNFDFGSGVISPVLLVNLLEIIPAWRRSLADEGNLMEENFDSGLLVESAQGIVYKEIEARKIIFCDGARGAENHWFSLLPFALNKGEALIIRLPGLITDKVFKKGMSLIPLYDDVFWLGSTYEWEFSDALPSETFKRRAEEFLHIFLKTPFEIIDHVSALRPATLERRPFVGFHPRHPNIGILNGMGTKGCSLAPWFARQLAKNIAGHGSIDPAVDIRRFTGILNRK